MSPRDILAWVAAVLLVFLKDNVDQALILGDKRLEQAGVLACCQVDHDVIVSIQTLVDLVLPIIIEAVVFEPGQLALQLQAGGRLAPCTGIGCQ